MRTGKSGADRALPHIQNLGDLVIIQAFDSQANAIEFARCQQTGRFASHLGLMVLPFRVGRRFGRILRTVEGDLGPVVRCPERV